MHHPRKRFGQHFLHDHNILRKIIRGIRLSPLDRMVEIGPGQGALTRFLLETLAHLDAVELDHDLVRYLREKFFSQQLTVHAGDALRFDFDALWRASGTNHQKLRIVGNLPYNISTPLLFHLFSQLHCIEDMHFMLQKEVVSRLTAKTGEPAYGRLSIMAQYFCDTEALFTVSANAFTPPPKVASAIIRLTPKKQLSLNQSEFSVFCDIVKEAFNYRRKKLSNSLKRFVTQDQLVTLKIDPNNRPEALSMGEYIRIARAISVDS